MARFDLWSLAFNPEDAQRNAQLRLSGDLPAPSAVAWQFLLEELREAFSVDSLHHLHAHPDNRKILQLMLSSFPLTAGRTGLLSRTTRLIRVCISVEFPRAAPKIPAVRVPAARSFGAPEMLRPLLFRPSTISLCLLMVGLLSAQSAAQELRILPAQLSLTGSRLPHKVLVETFRNGQPEGPAPDALRIISDHPEIVRVEGRTLIPVTDGTTFIRIADSPAAAPAKVTVSGTQNQANWSFRRHVEPVLAPSGLQLRSLPWCPRGKGWFPAFTARLRP
jgi:hypothetical protein